MLRSPAIREIAIAKALKAGYTRRDAEVIASRAVSLFNNGASAFRAINVVTKDIAKQAAACRDDNHPGDSFA
jgi:hypothetical protein